jgi:hypothetical protein
MHDDHDKLIAKIQFFYDYICQKHDSSITEVFKGDHESMKLSTHMLSVLAEEYGKIFEDFIYTE